MLQVHRGPGFVLEHYQGGKKTLRGIEHALNSVLVSSSSFIFLMQISTLENARHIFYFIFLQLSNNDVAEAVALMETVATVIPTDANVYWILGNRSNGTRSAKFEMWETYSVKNITSVNPVPTSNVQAFSFFGKVAEGKWQRRHDFRGAVITATAVVRPALSFITLGCIAVCLQVLVTRRTPIFILE